MYKVWYCPVRKPMILFSMEEVQTLSRMIHIVSGSTPYWEKIITLDD
tara:strand:+ start:801 stop:941 length:141 start_codon:yes stop_codon:yes gene_type:complete